MKAAREQYMHICVGKQWTMRYVFENSSIFHHLTTLVLAFLPSIGEVSWHFLLLSVLMFGQSSEGSGIWQLRKETGSQQSDMTVEISVETNKQMTYRYIWYRTLSADILHDTSISGLRYVPWIEFKQSRSRDTRAQMAIEIEYVVLVEGEIQTHPKIFYTWTLA